jgi:hypothetical protein
MTTRKKHKAMLLAVEAVAAQNGICRKNDTQLQLPRARVAPDGGQHDSDGLRG